MVSDSIAIKALYFAYKSLCMHKYAYCKYNSYNGFIHYFLPFIQCEMESFQLGITSSHGNTLDTALCAPVVIV